MGDMAEAMIDGSCCQECGIFFKQAHGYPVLCRGCWAPGSATPKAINPEI